MSTADNVIVLQTITCATWLVRRGFSSLALEMRDDLVHMQDSSPEAWNAQIDVLLGDNDLPEDSIRLIEEVRYE